MTPQRADRLRADRIATLRLGEVAATACREAVTTGEDHRVHARLHACHCAGCGRPLEVSEPVRIDTAGSIAVANAYLLLAPAAFGTCCARIGERAIARPCPSCSRPVYGRMPSALAVCSELCRSRYARRRRTVRYFLCLGCGRNGDASVRADRRYCSPACRQRAYRRRRSPSPVPTCAICGGVGVRLSGWSDGPFVCEPCSRDAVVRAAEVQA